MNLPNLKYALQDGSPMEMPVLRVLKSKEPLWVAFHLPTIGRPFVISTPDQVWRGSMSDEDVAWLDTSSAGDKRFSPQGDFEVLDEATATMHIELFNRGEHVSS